MKKILSFFICSLPLYISCASNGQQKEDKPQLNMDITSNAEMNHLKNHPIIGSWSRFSSPGTLSGAMSYEFKPNGQYSYLTIIESSMPAYKIITRFEGTFKINGNQIQLIPKDWHMQKWDSDGKLEKDVHENRPAETSYWRIEFDQQMQQEYLYIAKEKNSTVGFARIKL
jgi:hypothetical protein